MKYKYSKVAILIQYIIFVLFDFLVIALATYLKPNDTKFLMKIIFGVTGILVFMILTYSKELINKYVVLYDDYICFNSFRFKGYQNTSSVNVKYEDVLSVDVKAMPLIGVWAIQINAKNLPQKVTVSFCFCKHKDLYVKLCEAVKRKNPKVYIDIRLERIKEIN